MPSTSACCPLCDEMDSIDHIALRCINPTMNGTYTNRHHDGLSFCVKALSKGRYGSSLIGMDACCKERLLEQGIEVPKNVFRTVPDWVFPMVLAPLTDTIAALMLSLCALSQDDLPTLILLGSFLKTGTFTLLYLNSALVSTSLEAATAQHANISKKRLKTAARETLTRTTRHKAKSLASKLSCRAFQRLTTTT
eukprot:1160501-Pelagomonas_calceolata.AAC.14